MCAPVGLWTNGCKQSYQIWHNSNPRPNLFFIFSKLNLHFFLYLMFLGHFKLFFSGASFNFCKIKIFTLLEKNQKFAILTKFVLNQNNFRIFGRFLNNRFFSIKSEITILINKNIGGTFFGNFQTISDNHFFFLLKPKL